MKKQLIHVAPVQAGKVAAVIYLVISIPLVLLMMIPAMFTEEPGIPVMLLMFMPVLYAVFGFVFTVIGAWIYNLVAGKIGGIEYTTVEVK